ncbi:hypothetical protein HMPREF0239_01675 [Clostridium sp. ATCC BAA-442]|nr:hypothetical protein HMPREF0239_01675 [Clostridium sp. ATCC BAA-442]
MPSEIPPVDILRVILQRRTAIRQRRGGKCKGFLIFMSTELPPCAGGLIRI